MPPGRATPVLLRSRLRVWQRPGGFRAPPATTVTTAHCRRRTGCVRGAHFLARGTTAPHHALPLQGSSWRHRFRGGLVRTLSSHRRGTKGVGSPACRSRCPQPRGLAPHATHTGAPVCAGFHTHTHRGHTRAVARVEPAGRHQTAALAPTLCPHTAEWPPTAFRTLPRVVGAWVVCLGVSGDRALWPATAHTHRHHHRPLNGLASVSARAGRACTHTRERVQTRPAQGIHRTS